ncbi:D-alanyl-D-alanine carboxypeptidase [Tranquillimonas rosea]|uniref:D-alanyl-D-alanine carboxypeptidase n=1 Tax=Tranquillimonas rosea TaxID=641238 RepID=A0A1H9R4H6_9RHOB|nr:D-alanyl-D-alanine carboxypeptidase family protein [Tranquillimonas rosea]SER66843.1 D-alanyl-D-alanine carboxypeptidase [Tranquillimonas rosea]
MPHRAEAAPYAAMVIDARSGEVLHSNNADTRLHPASLTKMMTLYIAFEAVENGEVSLDEKVRISKNAAAEPPSKLGLREGQSIAFRYLIRAASVKSANDAATAIGETLEGSEAAFARRMTRTAKALGMTRTTFKNAHGLTEEGHLSTARDMTLLGRRLFFDYPQYYNLFSRRTTHAGIREVANTNRRLLGAYKGADGIKTGYTRAAGFNLVASADRGGERIIATVFGGRSSASRNAKVAELLDLGFSRAPTRVAINRPAPVPYPAAGAAGVGRAAPAIAVLARSLRPRSRPGAPATTLSDEVVVALKEDIKQAVAEVADTPKTAPSTLADAAAAPQAVRTISVTPQPRPARQVAEAAPATPAEGAADPDGELRVVTRLSTSGGRHWGINVGRYGSRYHAERMLLKTALLEIGTLNDALRKVVRKPRGFEANFVGMSAEQASLACRRLAARDVECDTFGPG